MLIVPARLHDKDVVPTAVCVKVRLEVAGQVIEIVPFKSLWDQAKRNVGGSRQAVATKHICRKLRGRSQFYWGKETDVRILSESRPFEASVKRYELDAVLARELKGTRMRKRSSKPPSHPSECHVNLRSGTWCEVCGFNH